MPDTSGPHPTPPAPAAKKPLTIVMGCDTFAPDVNGAARFAERLAAGLVDRGHDVHIVAPAASRRHGTWIEEHEGQKMTAHRLRSWRWYPHDWLRFALPWMSKANARRVLDEVRPDVVHFHHFMNLGVDMLTLTRRLLPDCRIVFTFHEFLSICLAYGQMVRTVDRSLCAHASAVRCHQCFPEHAPETFFVRKQWFQEHLRVVDLFTVPSRFMIASIWTWSCSASTVSKPTIRMLATLDLH